jgi:hypothetical protein
MEAQRHRDLCVSEALGSHEEPLFNAPACTHDGEFAGGFFACLNFDLEAVVSPTRILRSICSKAKRQEEGSLREDEGGS